MDGGCFSKKWCENGSWQEGEQEGERARRDSNWVCSRSGRASVAARGCFLACRWPTTALLLLGQGRRCQGSSACRVQQA